MKRIRVSNKALNRVDEQIHNESSSSEDPERATIQRYKKFMDKERRKHKALTIKLQEMDH